MPNKPLYGRVLTTRDFNTEAEADDYAKEMKAQYKQADISIKHDIVRTEATNWRAIIYVKL